MHDAIVRIYNKKGDKNVVQAAIGKGWLSEAQYQEITGEDLPA